MNDWALTGQIAAFLALVAGGGTVWGKLNEKVKEHDKAVENCHMENYKLNTECSEFTANCPGAKYSADTHAKVVRMESDIKEIKNKLNRSDEKFHDFQVTLGATISRIETTLKMIRGMQS